VWDSRRLAFVANPPPKKSEGIFRREKNNIEGGRSGKEHAPIDWGVKERNEVAKTSKKGENSNKNPPTQ
jgi:hypothetical protein